MGKEVEWLKMTPDSALVISDEEWNNAEALVRELIENKKETLPFKLSRKAWEEKHEGKPEKFNHSFIVIPDPEVPGGFKIVTAS
jgi:hypothetical protein